MQRVW